MGDMGPGIRGEVTAYRDSKVPDKLMGPLRQSLRINLLPGEELLGLFASYRLRRAITTLVVTDRRLLTLGDVDKGMPVVDEVDRSSITALHVEREKMLSSGRLVAETQLGPVSLGTLDYAGDGSTFLGLDEVLSRGTVQAGMPVIPVPGHRGDGPVQDGVPVQAGAAARETHPLVAHLRALADLHERGALTDEEFAAAKARLLERPGG